MSFENLKDAPFQHAHDGSKLKTWDNGVAFVGTITDMTTQDRFIVIKRTEVVKCSQAQGKALTTQVSDDEIKVDACTKFSNDDKLGFGRITFELEDRSLATIYPPGIDPFAPIPDKQTAA